MTVSLEKEFETRGVVSVGEARGFVVEGEETLPGGLTRSRRYVITAAHNFPHLPPAYSASDTSARTYKDI